MIFFYIGIIRLKKKYSNLQLYRRILNKVQNFPLSFFFFNFTFNPILLSQKIFFRIKYKKIKI